MSTFARVVEAGSFTAVAAALGTPKSSVSRAVLRLEEALGVRLLQRTTRKLTLTEDGQTFLPRAQQILYQAREAAAEMAQRRGTLAGPLRVSGPVGFGILHLGPALNHFLSEHPDIDLTLELDDAFVDAAASGFDAVIRHGPVGDTRLVAKRLARTRRVLVASPAYLAAKGRPAGLPDLSRHCGVLYANRDGDWRFAGAEGWTVVRPRAALRVNNGLVMRDAALAGLGVTLLPTFFVHEQLASGALVELDVGVEAEGAELFLAYPRDRGASAKIAALTASLRRSFGDPPYWDVPAKL